MATQDFTKYIDYVQACAMAALPAIIANDNARGMNRAPDRACDLAFSYGKQMMAEAIKFENELTSRTTQEQAHV